MKKINKQGKALFAISILVIISIMLTSLIWMQLTSEDWKESPIRGGVVGGTVTVNIIPVHEDGMLCFNGEDDDSDGLLDCEDDDCDPFCDGGEHAELYKQKLEESRAE